ncbi:S-adenosyl-L-methionine-dependent methyltransferase [Rhodotorula sp. JG-1b]|nr:S-adenosyl-L-methionine-dependent methyltransferase [Rhodotorula sp. JG-1b]
MSTFAKRSFDAVAYAASRPSYPPALFQHVLTYLNYGARALAPHRTLLDCGCGPGLSTFDWIDHHTFDHIVGIDPSAGMIKAANDILRDRTVPDSVNIEFKVGRADHLQDLVEDESVDLVVAGQAAHWFDPEPTYSELARVLKPGGAFAFWGYGEFYFPTRPDLSALIPPYSAGTLGPYWEQPGRSIVESLLVPFPFPSRALTPSFDPTSYTRSFFLREPTPSGTTTSSPLPFKLEGLAPDAQSGTYTLDSDRSAGGDGTRTVLLSRSGSLLTRDWTLAQLVGYLRTWSAAHAYNEKNPAAATAAHDCVDEFVAQLQEHGLGLGSDGQRAETIQVAWDVGLIMGRKKQE